MDKINLTPIIQSIIALLAALITYKVIPWIKSKTTAQQQKNFQALVRVLVYAAEQIFGAGNGKEKLEYVCGELEMRGYEIDLPEIEAAVYAAFNEGAALLRPNEPSPAPAGGVKMEGYTGNENTVEEGAVASAGADKPETPEGQG